MIAVIKKGNIIPVKLFKDYWKCGKWCDEFIKKNKGYDPQQYEVIEINLTFVLRLIKKHYHAILYRILK